MMNRRVVAFMVIGVVHSFHESFDGQKRIARPCSAAIVMHADTTLDASNAWPSLLTPVRSKTPRYPEQLKLRGTQGEVRASYVIDTLGRVVRGTISITRETEREFGDAVCASLAGAEFAPVVIGGKRMSVLVQNVPTAFTLNR